MRKVLIGLALVPLVASCGIGSSGPDLILPPSISIVGEGKVHQGDTVTVGSMFTCLTKSGSVTIESVEPVKPTGLKATGWAIRPNPSWPGHESPTTGRGQVSIQRKPLSALQFSSSHTTDLECDDDTGKGVEIAVQLKKITSGEATASGFRVTYTSDGDTKSVLYPLGARLCNEDTADARPCREALSLVPKGDV